MASVERVWIWGYKRSISGWGRLAGGSGLGEHDFFAGPWIGWRVVGRTAVGRLCSGIGGTWRLLCVPWRDVGMVRLAVVGIGRIVHCGQEEKTENSSAIKKLPAAWCMAGRSSSAPTQRVRDQLPFLAETDAHEVENRRTSSLRRQAPTSDRLVAEQLIQRRSPTPRRARRTGVALVSRDSSTLRFSIAVGPHFHHGFHLLHLDQVSSSPRIFL